MNILNYKKPKVWVVIVAVAAVCTTLVGFALNPKEPFDLEKIKAEAIKPKQDTLGHLLNSGEKTNIQSVNDVPNVDSYEKVEANGEVYYIYEKEGKYYSEKPYQYINELTEETYRKILSLIIWNSEYQKIKEELSLVPEEYSAEDAAKDGCFVVVHGKVASEFEIADKFIKDTQSGKKASIKIVQYTEEGDHIITKVIYDGTSYYGVEDDSRDAFKGDGLDYHEFEYKYLKVFEDKGKKYVLLVNDNGLTLEKIRKSLLSSNFNDHIDSLWFYFVTE